MNIFQPFVNLPTRALKDYYQLIKDPMSLSAIKKKVQGVVGRDAPTGHTLFKSWDSFEQAFSLVWTNARIYNEDGSELYNLSLELEVCNIRPELTSSLTVPGNLQTEARCYEGQGRRTATAQAQAQHVWFSAKFSTQA